MKRNCSILILITAIFLTACGPIERREGALKPTAGAASQVDRSGFDWRTGEWKTDLSAGEAHTLYLEEYKEGMEADGMGDRSTLYRAWGSRLYGLDCFALSLIGNDTTQWSYSLNCYDGNSGEIQKRVIFLPSLPDYAEQEKLVGAFDVMSDSEMVLFVQAREEDNCKAYLAVHMTMSGTKVADADVVDLQPAIQENGGRLEEGYALEEVYVDHRGYYYVIPDLQKGRVLVLGPDGALTEVLEGDRAGMWVQFACKNPDGDPVFKWHDEESGKVKLMGYEPESGSKVYANAELPWNSPMTITEDGYLYFCDTDGNLYRWDLYLGNREFCIDYKSMGLGANQYMLQMITAQDGNPILLDHARGNARIYCLGTDPQQQTTMIRLVSLTPECDYISACAFDFARMHAGCGIVVEKPEASITDPERYFSEIDTFRTRTMADLTAGNTADLYFVSAADMKILYEQGALADLTGVLPAQLTKNIFPGVLEGGVIDGKQTGLAPEAEVTIAMVSNQLWEKDSWTLEEALDMVESDPKLKYLLIDLSFNSGRGVLASVFFRDLENSPFLNLEKGICDFTNPLFIRLLEHVKGYGDFQKWDFDPLEAGVAAGFYQGVGSYPGFTYLMAQYGDQYHPVGFPTDGRSGNYWYSDYYLVMSKDTPNREILEEYLAELFSAERQKNCFKSVRNDLIPMLTVYSPSSNRDSDWVYDRGNGVYQTVYVKPDGSTWEQEYLDLLNSCVPRSDDLDFIVDIIFEETESFFDGSKDASAAAEIIQNKVQLYLDEHN